MHDLYDGDFRLRESSSQQGSGQDVIAAHMDHVSSFTAIGERLLISHNISWDVRAHCSCNERLAMDLILTYSPYCKPELHSQFCGLQS